jgi:FkbM family methyltransferase
MTASQQRTAKVSWMTRIASALVTGYIRHFPFERTKWRLMQMARSFLVVELHPGVFMRLANVTVIEKEIVREGMFERETVEVFLALLSSGMTVLDVGANIGQYTLVAAHAVGPYGQVHAFEPTAEIASELRCNVALNEFQNVTINEVAVADSRGEQLLYCTDPGSPGTNTIMNPVEQPCTTSKVRTVTLDDYLAERGVSDVDVMKLDVEGAELLVLRGAERLLRGPRAPVLLLEVNPRTLALSGSSAELLLELLKDWGYTYYPIATYGVQTHDPWANGLAAKPAHFDRFSNLQRLCSQDAGMTSSFRKYRIQLSNSGLQ